MELLVRASLAVRRGARRGVGLATALALGAFDVIDAQIPLDSPWVVGAAVVWLGILGACCRPARRAGAGEVWNDLEVGALLVAATYGALGRAEGGLSGPLYPLVYVLVASVSAFARPLAAALVVGLLVTLEGSIRYAALAERTFVPLALHAVFIATFAVLHLVFLRAEIARIRVRSRARLEAEVARMRDAARSYRLLGAPRGPADAGPARSGDDEKLARSSVEEIHQAVLFALELLRQSLGLHTALLLWQNEAGTHARISELSSDADNVCEGPFLSGDGVIGAVLVRRANVVLEGLKPGYKLPYYSGSCPVRAVCGVPVMDHGHPRGVLLVDRVDERPFTIKDEEMLTSATRYIARAIQNERVFVQLERAKVEQVLFTKRLAPPPMPSVLVLPLLVHDHALGTLVLGAKRKNAFGDAVRPTLEVLARHMAVSLANARMVRKLEELATTDGLTGLLNKRAMLEMASQKVAAASRFSRHLSVLVTDIDFFKKVNDAHGHDVGDIVIRGMADVLRKAKRTTDAVARFGGEEFVVICEETDAKGAMLLAERVRKEVEAKAFVTAYGPLKVTCSIGIATFPEAGRDWDALFKAADGALYASKRGGRNRSTAWSPQRRITAA